MPASPVFRFAPSPNGRLHLGHALSAMLNAEAARRTRGRFLVRLEDYDQARSTDANIAGVLDDLAWLGLLWERPERRQSEHMGTYAAALKVLAAEGLIYRCFASRGEIAAAIADRPGWPRDPDGTPLYPGLWRGAAPDRVAAAITDKQPFAWRLDMTKAAARVGRLSWIETGQGAEETVAANPEAWGDVILARKDVLASYHLAVVCDDALQGVSHVIRGRDLYHATSLHRMLQVLLGLTPPAYHHHRLILDCDGRKLSKSVGSASLQTLRASGASLSDVKGLIDWMPERDLGGLGPSPGWSPKPDRP